MTTNQETFAGRLVNAEDLAQIRLLSDGELYQKAIGFVPDFYRQAIDILEDMKAEKKIKNYQDKDKYITKSQLSGLLQYSQNWNDLKKYVKHQKNDRSWPDSKAHYKRFYANIESSLQEIRDLVTQHKFVQGDLPDSRKARQRYNVEIDEVAGLLSQTFIQHLVAEMRWQAVMPKPTPTRHEENDHAE